MRFCCLVLIAAVAVNSLVTTINARSTTSKTVTEPFNMLLPPLVDKTEDATATKAKTNAKTGPETSSTTVVAVSVINETTEASVKTKKTTLKPLTNDVNNVGLPELSIEALLPPLHEAKIEKAENDNKQETEITPDETTTLRTTTPFSTAATKLAKTTKTPKTTTTTTTTKTTTKTTTTRTTTTPTTTTKASKIITTTAVPPAIALEALLPPLESEINNGDGSSTTSIIPYVSKSLKKSFYKKEGKQSNNNTPSQPSLQVTDFPSPKTEDTLNKSTKGLKSHSKSKNFVRNVDTFAAQDTKKQVVVDKQQANNKYRSAFNSFGFDVYLGSTTPRPPKQGLPTITPFPNRLGR